MEGQSEEQLSQNVLEHLRALALTDVGRRREENQDTYGILTSDDFHLYVVADGMGGVKGGAIASNLAIEAFTEALSSSGISSEQDLINATNLANERIFQRGQQNEDLSGMGTTVVGVAFSKDQAYLFHVGDSRAYLIRNGGILQLTSDHTLVNELVRSGAMTESQAERSPVAHMLTRSLGPSSEVLVDCVRLRDAPAGGDIFLLCSDGLYNLVDREEMLAAVVEWGFEEATAKLIDLANHRGGTDNITITMVQVGGDYNYHSTALDRDVLGLTAEFDPAATTAVNLPSFADQEFSVEETYYDQNYGREIASVAGAAAAESKAQGAISLEARLSLDRLRGAVVGEANPADQQKVAQEVAQTQKIVRDEIEQEATKVIPSRSEAIWAKLGKLASPNFSAARFVSVLGTGFLGGALVVTAFIWFSSSEPDSSSLTTPKAGSKTAKLDAELVESMSITNKDSAVSQQPEVVGGAASSSPVQPSGQTQPARSDQWHGVQPSSVDDGDHDEIVLGEDRKQIETRLALVGTRLSRVQERLGYLEAPEQFRVDEILGKAKQQIAQDTEKLKGLRSQIEQAERRLGVWYKRKDGLKEASPVNMAREVAVSSDPVRKLKAEFEEATYKYLKALEEQRYNPSDPEAAKRVSENLAARRGALDRLTSGVIQAVDDAIEQATRDVYSLTRQREEVSQGLEEAQWEVRFAQAVADKDPRLRVAVKEQLTNEALILAAEKKELVSLLGGYGSVQDNPDGAGADQENAAQWQAAEPQQAIEQDDLNSPSDTSGKRSSLAEIAREF